MPLSPPFLCNLHLGQFVKCCNLHLGQFVKCFNNISWLKHLTNCPKWRLHKKGGLVAYARSIPKDSHATIFCNHLAKFMLPKRRFWKAERTFGNGFSKHFSKVRVLGLGDVPLKSALKIRSRMFVHVASKNCAISGPPT